MEERKLLFMAETDHLRLFFDLTRVGVKVTEMFTAPVEETKTGKKVFDALCVVGKAEKDIWDCVCEAMSLKLIRGYWM